MIAPLPLCFDRPRASLVSMLECVLDARGLLFTLHTVLLCLPSSTKYLYGYMYIGSSYVYHMLPGLTPFEVTRTDVCSLLLV